MRKLFLPLMFLPTVFCCACNPLCLEGSGPHEDERRELKMFSSIEVDIPVDVVIHNGASSEVKIFAQENILKIITTLVSNGKLHIDANRCFESDEPIRIEIHTSDLSKLELNGSGSITVADTFQVKDISLKINGSGTIEARMIASEINSAISGSGILTLIGSANDQQAEVSGSGEIDASLLPCNQADAELSGSGSIHLYALEKIRADISGSGNIFYKGNPDVKSDISGSGKVISNN